MLNLAPVSFSAARSSPHAHCRGRRPLALLLTFIGALAAFGCSSSGDSAPLDTSTTDGGADGDGDTEVTESIAFDESETLELAPSGVAQVVVQVSPARRQTVTFEILSDVEPFNGYLTGNTVIVADDGTATVEVHAPSEPSGFEIRASLPSGAEARRSVSVSVRGRGSVRVVPVYAGSRSISRWYASAWPGLTCDRLDSTFVSGPHAASSTKEPLITNVPAGTLFAVSLQGDGEASGCSTVSQLSTDQELSIRVSVTDRPINVTSGKLLMTLGVEAAVAEFATILESSISDSAATFLMDHTTDASALLDRISAELPDDDQSAFEGLLESEEIVGLVEAELSSPTAISDTVRATLTIASTHIEGPDKFDAVLSLKGSESEFELLKAAGTDAKDAGFEVTSHWQVEVEPGDKVSLGGEISFNPVLWLTEIAELQAEESDDADPVLALSAAASCEGVVAALEPHLIDGKLVECDTDCLRLACAQQAATLWEEIKSSGSQRALRIGANAQAVVGENAEIETLTGSWLGQTGGSTTSIKGPLLGKRQ